MESITVETTPFQDQRPGTSGLRKKVKVFQQRHYLENFVQSIFDCLDNSKGSTLVLGGDGRYFNDDAIQVIVKIAVANGIGKLVIGRDGLLSTPAVSDLIRKQGAIGGIVLSASHNPAGPDKDFGIKFNTSNGGPAPEHVTEAIYQRSREIDKYTIIENADIPLGKVDQHQMGQTQIQIIDPVADYLSLMEGLFDFDRIHKLLSSASFKFCFDAMHAITGPYAKKIFEDVLAAPAGSVFNAIPLADFGGGHPDPNLVHAQELLARMNGESPADFGAASDGDGDRNLLLAANFYINPCDSLAILTANAHMIPAYKNGLVGVARSMPTSSAVDHVARQLNIPCFETPSGWKYFGNLMDANRITICGEESFGTGSNHVREKDGIWAVLFWLNIISVCNESVENIVRHHWQQFGRTFFTRHDYEKVSTDGASALMESLRERLPKLQGESYDDKQISKADEFSYTDPTDGTVADKQGIRLFCNDGARIIYRLSGTGTEGATLRVYIEHHQPETDKHGLDANIALKEYINIATQVAGTEHYLDRTSPDVIT
jgi:phosphoglucomutase